MIAHIIDLVDRPRFGAQLVNDLATCGITGKLFAAIDGRSRQRTMRVAKRGFKRGEIGCFASHVEIARSAVKGLIEPVTEYFPWWLICEDDALPVGIDPDFITSIIEQARAFDLIFIHFGRARCRETKPFGLSPMTRADTGTYAYLANRAALADMSQWIMRHPIDKAIAYTSRFRRGVLSGPRAFGHRHRSRDVPSIFFE